MWDLIVSVPDHCLSFYFISPDSCFKNNVPSECTKTNGHCYQLFSVCQISTELRPWSYADCTLKFENLIHIYGTSCRYTRFNKTKHSGGVSCTVMLAPFLFDSGLVSNKFNRSTISFVTG